MMNIEEIKFEEKKRGQAGMSVPEGFFAEFQQKLEAEIDRQETLKVSPALPQEPHIGQQPRLGWFRWTAAAACAVLVCGLGYFVTQLDSDMPSANSGTSFAAVEVDDESVAEDMLLGSLSDFDLYDLYCDAD